MHQKIEVFEAGPKLSILQTHRSSMAFPFAHKQCFFALALLIMQLQGT
jgi:hypothetical protein